MSKRGEAFDLYLLDVPIREISNKLHVDYGTITQWQRRDGWSSKKKKIEERVREESRKRIEKIKRETYERNITSVENLSRLQEKISSKYQERNEDIASHALNAMLQSKDVPGLILRHIDAIVKMLGVAKAEEETQKQDTSSETSELENFTRFLIESNEIEVGVKLLQKLKEYQSKGRSGDGRDSKK